MQSFCKNVGVVEILASRNLSRVIVFAASLLGKTPHDTSEHECIQYYKLRKVCS